MATPGTGSTGGIVLLNRIGKDLLLRATLKTTFSISGSASYFLTA